MEINQRRKISKQLKGKYIGIPAGEGRKDGKYLFCKYCNNKFYRHKKYADIAKFCSQKCYFDYKNNIFNPLIKFKHTNQSKKNIKIGHNKALEKESYHINLKKSFKKRQQKYGNSLGVKDYNAKIEKIRRNTIKQHLRGGFPQTNTIIERIIEKKLKENKIDFEHPFAFGRFVCDFAILNNKIIIECDGDYWHNREDIKKKDKAKNAYIKKSGWKILRFWETDIKNNPDNCIKVIQEEVLCKN